MALPWPEFLELPQMQRAFVIALIIGPACGLLGTFVTLRRMSLLSDAIAHASLTGVTLAFLLNIASDWQSPALSWVLIVFCSGVALIMTWLAENTRLQTDSIIAISYAGSVALGVTLITRLRDSRALENTLFGDILAARNSDVWLIAIVCAVATGFVLLNLRPLTLAAVQESLARAEGFRICRLNYLFALVIALVIALLLRQLGALLISGVLVVPPAAARLLSRNFRSMFLLAALFGLSGATLGVFASYHLDTPTGPSMVLADVAILVGSMLVASWWKRRSPTTR